MESLFTPEVIEAASKSTLGIFSQMIAILGVVALAFFRNSSVPVRMSIFLALLIGVSSYGYALVEAERKISKPKLDKAVVWELNPSTCSRIASTATATVENKSGNLVISTNARVGTAEIYCPINGLDTNVNNLNLDFDGAFINWNNEDGSGAGSGIKVTSASTPDKALENSKESITIASKVAGIVAERVPSGRIFNGLSGDKANGLIIYCRSAWNISVKCEYLGIKLTIDSN